MTDVLKRAKEVKERIGEITFENVKAYIESLGYDVIEFNTVKGDKMLKDLRLYSNIKDCCGKTFKGKHVQLVSINGEKSLRAKLIILLHELGHVVLHFNDDYFHEFWKTVSVEEKDMEAETFAYALFHGESEE